jgi:hypothetical protein
MAGCIVKNVLFQYSNANACPLVMIFVKHAYVNKNWMHEVETFRLIVVRKMHKNWLLKILLDCSDIAHDLRVILIPDFSKLFRTYLGCPWPISQARKYILGILA